MKAPSTPHRDAAAGAQAEDRGVEQAHDAAAHGRRRQHLHQRLGDRREGQVEHAGQHQQRHCHRVPTDALVTGLTSGPPSDPLRARLAPLIELAFQYASTGDLATLALLLRDRTGIVSLGWSPDLRAGYLMVEVRRGPAVARAVALLGSQPGTTCATIPPGPNADLEVWRAIQRWCVRLEITGLATP